MQLSLEHVYVRGYCHPCVHYLRWDLDLYQTVLLEGGERMGTLRLK